MRRLWLGLLLGSSMVGLASCKWSDPTGRPPLREEYVLPPADDPRFSSPPTFPKESLDNDPMKKDHNKLDDPLKMPGSSPGSSPGSGGMRSGMGGGGY